MILQCPECRTRYMVPDNAIGPTGRAVRCAACRHSWFQDGPALADLPAPALSLSDLPQPAPAPLAEPAPEPTPPPPDPWPEPEPVAEPAYAAPEEEPASDADFAAFQRERRRRGRRNPARLWTIAAAVAGLLMVLGIGALTYFGAPGVAARLGLPVGQREVPLLLDQNPVTERRTLASGNELFAITGRVINPTGEAQPVPDILAELRDGDGRVVYSWAITPPIRSLPPHGATEFNSAQVDVPKGARELNLSFAGSSATAR